jgi:hypothetical protein
LTISAIQLDFALHSKDQAAWRIHLMAEQILVCASNLLNAGFRCSLQSGLLHRSLHWGIETSGCIEARERIIASKAGILRV